MSIENKTKIAAGLLALVLVIVVVFWLWPLFSQIRETADSFISQKNRLAELEAKKENLEVFAANRETYRDSLERIDNLFVNSREPIGFIEFLEKEAGLAGISIEITPVSPQKIEGDPWESMNFRLLLEGDFSDVARFLEALEYGDYLLQPLNLSISRMEKNEDKVSATLNIKVYSK
ncbi:MAG: hypothetical protein HYT21_01805 [Candidatus Nealsonbacteria bacterium]|nr:hypothetical protein [Candidatus Nealsonbacteria bacterium]